MPTLRAVPFHYVKRGFSANEPALREQFIYYQLEFFGRQPDRLPFRSAFRQSV